MNKYYIILMIFVSFTFINCGDCNSLSDYYRDHHFDIILEKMPAYGRAYTLQGINPVYGNQEKYRSQGGFLGLDFRDLISVGDTLVKKPGELKVYIHKKDTVIVFPFKCEGKVYE